MSLPLPLYLNLLAVALCVLIFGNFFVSWVDYGWMVQTNWGTTPSPVLWRMPSTTVAVQALLALRAQDHKHRTSFQIGLLLDLACIL
jgi:hypothetical protein